MSSPSPSIGQVLGHYRILEQIGAGGMGVVYRARDLQLERDVALKVLPAGTLRDSGARVRFHKEARALARLNHPNIATVHEFGSQDGVDFLVTEYIAGITLDKKLLGGAIPEPQAVILGLELAQALESAHEQGVVHRDLKPGNLRLTAKGQLKVLDFGLAKIVPSVDPGVATESLGQNAVLSGTLPYMSPEQVRGEPADERSDIWAAGTVLYEMVSGQRPFPERRPAQLIQDILLQAPRPPTAVTPRVSPGLEAIILKALDKDPERRYQSARELATDLRRLNLPDLSPHSRQQRFRSLAGLRGALGALMAVLVVVLLVFVVLHLRNSRLAAGGEPRITSIAVLPVANLAHDPGQDYLADGMTEALITELGQVHSLKRVISRTSVMQFKTGLKSVPEIGRELNVDAVVEGSVLRSGDSLELTVRLVNAASDAQLWSERYQRKMGDVIALQRELALDIAHGISLSLTPLEQAGLRKARPVNPEVEDLYLKGSYLDKGNAEQQRKAREYFEQAIRIDPNYAPAYAGLAEYYWFTPDLGRSEAAPKAEQYALKALELDPNLAAAHTSLGILRFYADWDWTAAEQEFRRAIELNPNDAEAHRMYAVYLSAQARPEQAQAEIARAQEVDPLYLWTQITAGFIAYFGHRYDDALAQCRRALDLDPNSAGGQDCLGTVYLAKGMYPEAIAACERAVQLSHGEPSRLVGLGRAYALAGRSGEAQKVLDELSQKYKHSHISPYYLATLEVALGHKQAAIAWLKRAYEEHDTYLIWAKVDSALDPVRSDSRFQTLLQHLGLTAATNTLRNHASSRVNSSKKSWPRCTRMYG